MLDPYLVILVQREEGEGPLVSGSIRVLWTAIILSISRGCRGHQSGTTGGKGQDFDVFGFHIEELCDSLKGWEQRND